MLSAPFVSRGTRRTKTLTIVQWSHFVPEYDKWFDDFAKDWGKKNGIAGHRRPHPGRRTSPRARRRKRRPRSGHDLFGWNGAGGAHLYRKFLVDVTSLVEETEKKYGKVSTIGRQIGYNQDDKTWSAFPDYYINFPGMYRKNLWDEIGMKPDTWDNVRIGGAKLKAKGHPVGISLGHSNDPNTTWRGLLWSYGARRPGRDRQEGRAQQQGDGRSRQVRRGALQGGDDAGRAVLGRRQQQPVYLASGVGSLIINPISAYRTTRSRTRSSPTTSSSWKPPKGPVRQIMGGCAPNSTASGSSPRTRKRRSSFSSTTPTTGRRPSRRATGYNNPVFANLVPKPMPILSNDPTSHSARQAGDPADSDEWSAVSGLSGTGLAGGRRGLQRLHHLRHDGEGRDRRR